MVSVFCVRLSKPVVTEELPSTTLNCYLEGAAPVECLKTKTSPALPHMMCYFTLT